MKPDNVPATVFFFEQVVEPTFEDPPGLTQYFRTNIGLTLQQEGLANDASFFVNRARKAAGLGVSDRIVLRLNCGLELGWALIFHYEKFVRNTRTVELRLNEPIVPGWELVECGPATHPLPMIFSISKVDTR